VKSGDQKTAASQNLLFGQSLKSSLCLSVSVVSVTEKGDDAMNFLHSEW
jgi:hypothetical protein